MIRILHVVGVMNRGGAEALIMELYRHIDRTKVQFDFLVYNYSNQPGAYDEEIRRLGGKIFEAKRKFYKGPIAFCRELNAFYKSHPEYNIIHIHQYAPSGYMAAMAKRANSNCITIFHSHSIHINTSFFRKFSENISKRLLNKNADFIFGCSKDAIKVRFKQEPDNHRYFVVNNAINVKKFAFNQEKRTQLRKKLDAFDDTIIIGNVARFTEEKNHKRIINVFDCFSQSHPNSRLLLIGDGPEKEKIDILVHQKKLEKKVVFLGVRDDVNELLNAFDVFLLPSQFEGLGIVLIEAQGNGLPCVISKGVIPQEADVGVGLVTRVDLQEDDNAWADACFATCFNRLEKQIVQTAVTEAGYEIKKVSKWLEHFYLEHWEINDD